MNIPKQKIVPVMFKAYDGKTYRGHSLGVRNGIATILYYVSGIGAVKAYVDDRSRIKRLHRS